MCIPPTSEGSGHSGAWCIYFFAMHRKFLADARWHAVLANDYVCCKCLKPILDVSWCVIDMQFRHVDAVTLRSDNCIDVMWCLHVGFWFMTQSKDWSRLERNSNGIARSPSVDISSWHSLAVLSCLVWMNSHVLKFKIFQQENVKGDMAAFLWAALLHPDERWSSHGNPRCT